MAEDKNPDLNFQTIAYLAGTRDSLPGEVINFIYFFFLSDISDIIAGKDDPGNAFTEIKYIPLTFRDYILSRECFDKMNNDLMEKKGNEILLRAGYDEYRKIIEERFDDKIFFKKESVINEFQDTFYDLLLNKLGYTLKDFGKNKENRFIEDIIQPLLIKLYYIRTGVKEEAYIFKDDADEFIQLAKKAIDEINIYQKSDFPNQPIYNLRDVCIECEFLNLCPGNRLWSANE